MWLLESQTLKQMRDAFAAGIHPSAQQQGEIVAAFGTNQDGSLRIMSKAGRTARISVSGMLTNSPNWFAVIFGGGNTLYPEVIKAIAMAEQDSEVDEIEMYFDTPGGSVAGLFDTVAAIQSAKKPVKAVIGNQAASAGYILASVADEVVAVNRASSVGSFGVAIDMSFSTDEELVSITNTESPDKRPDMKTAEGQAVVRKHLDALYDLFADSVATARGVTVEKMNQDFGRGAMFLAEEAVKRGMIDRVEGQKPALSVVTTTASKGVNPEASKMDLNKLKSEHPDVFAAAVAEGVTKERDRVSAFVVAGETSGDMKTALEAITSGAEMTTTLSTKFMMAAANRGAIAARDAESEEAAAAAAAGAQPDGERLSASEDVAKRTLALMGVEV